MKYDQVSHQRYNLLENKNYSFPWFNVLRLFLFHMHKTHYIFIYHFHLLYFYLFSYIHLPTTLHAILLKTYFQTKSNIICLQLFKDTYLTLTLSYFLILTQMNLLWPKKGGLAFFIDWWRLTVLMLKLNVIGFVKAMIDF